MEIRTVWDVARGGGGRKGTNDHFRCQEKV